MGDRAGDLERKSQLDCICGWRRPLAAIFALKNVPRIPGILIAVLGATAIVGLLGLADSANLSVLGPLPQGLPTFTIPLISYADIGPIVIGGLAVALVSIRRHERHSAASTPLERARMSIPTTSIGPGWTRQQPGSRLFQGLRSTAAPRGCPGARPRGTKGAYRAVCRRVVCCPALVGRAEPPAKLAVCRLGCGRDRFRTRLVRRSPTSYELFAFSLGNFGSRSSASRALRSLARSRELD